MARPTRRIVTGHDAQGRSIVLEDGPAPSIFEPKARPGEAITELWRSGAAPASNRGNDDPCAAPPASPQLRPPKNGTVFRIVDFPPDAQVKGADAAQLFAEFGASGAHAKDGRHAMMHKTATVDYALVLDGEIVAVMDMGEAVMRAGDVLIQRGTNHSWANRGDKPCRMAFILVDAEPL
jgi:mannose-6-phosphate isomerase-like protein (cupin superfamily)